MNNGLMALSLLVGFIPASLWAQESCPVAEHVSKVCGTLTVTDYMGVPGTTPKFWIQVDGKLVRLGTYDGNWGVLAAASYMHQNACLYSDQEVIEDKIDIAEFCR